MNHDLSVLIVEDDPHVLLGCQQALSLEDIPCIGVTCAEDALERVVAGPKGLEISLKPALAGRFGWASSVQIKAGPACEGRDEAFAALALMLGPIWQG